MDYDSSLFLGRQSLYLGGGAVSYVEEEEEEGCDAVSQVQEEQEEYDTVSHVQEEG